MKSKAKQIFLILAMLVSFARNSEASSVVEGALGTWITQQASPKLGNILAQHPRFKGERIKIMAMHNGQPIAITDKLTDHIREQLIEDLLTFANVKIVFNDAQRCNPIRVNTILGIEVQKHDSRQYRISLAMVDIEEGIWINGTNVFWHGRLTNHQRQALDTRAPAQDLATAFAIHQSLEISDALYQQIQCNKTIATPIYFTQANAEPEERVLRKLIEKIANQNLTTTNREDAASLISLRLVQGELRLDIAGSEQPDQLQTIAQVRVTEPGSATRVSHNRIRQRLTGLNVLSEIHVADHNSRDNVCARAKDNCIDISFELNRSAYTVIFYTINGQGTSFGCDLPGRLRAGTQHYGINVPVGDTANRPSVGFYALAFNDRSAANAVHRELRKSTAKCGGRHSSKESWIASLKRVLAQQGHELDWRAIHLTRDHGRTTIL